MVKTNYALDYSELVTLGDYPQNIRVRGTKADNPVLLFLHGGPGVSDRHWVLKYQSALADSCIMVCWDQRGSGKSYSTQQAKRNMNLEIMLNDTEELIKYLCKKFNQEKIYIVGHSWGSMLGVLISQRIPQNIAAYLGMGQVVNLDENERLSYKFVMDEAIKRNDKKALKILNEIGEPVNGGYGSLDNLIKQRNIMTKYGGGSYQQKENIWVSVIVPVLTSPEYSLYDLYKYARGSFYCLRQLWDELATTIRFDKDVKELAVPVYITQGEHDQNTPSVLAKTWFDNLKAPYKEWITFSKSAHSPIKEEPEAWGAIVKEKLFIK